MTAIVSFRQLRVFGIGAPPSKAAETSSKVGSLRADHRVPPSVNPAMQGRALPRTGVPAGGGARSTYSRAAVSALRARRIQGAIIALTSLASVRDRADRDAKVAALHDEADALAASGQDGCAEPATPQDLEALRQQNKALKKLIASVLPEAAAKGAPKANADPAALLRRGISETLNREAWLPVSTTMVSKGQAFANSLIPAAAMSLGNGHNIFPVDYQGKGVNCASATNVDHATNLWISRLSAPASDGQPAPTIFEGVRHGILSPYGLAEGSKERLEGAMARGKEVVTAALLLKPEALRDAFKYGTSIKLNLASSSLVTPLNAFGDTEKAQLADQVDAWRALAGQRPLQVAIRDDAGKMQNVAVHLDVAAFNFSVNELGLKVPLPFGINHADKLNQAAFTQLLGSLKPGAPIGGWAGEHLATQPQDRQAVRELCEQIREIFTKKRHRGDSAEPYALPQRVMRLTRLVGGVPAYNCKSGKDRTGMADTMAKVAAIEAYQNGGRSAPFRTRLTPEQKALHREVLLNSGNLDVQRYNTGAAGSKVMKFMPLPSASLTLVKELDRATYAEVKGLSRHV